MLETHLKQRRIGPRGKLVKGARVTEIITPQEKAGRDLFCKALQKVSDDESSAHKEYDRLIKIAEKEGAVPDEDIWVVQRDLKKIGNDELDHAHYIHELAKKYCMRKS